MLFSFFRRSKSPEKQEEVEDFLPSGIRSTVTGFVTPQSIPPMPSTARRAFELSVSPEAETRDFVALIETDEALASRVLKVANSVYFDRGNSSKTIEESVMTIGVDELRGLLQSTTLADVFPGKSPLRRFLWSHDVATALISRLLSEETREGSRDLTFLAGLMHDIGKLLLLHRYQDDYAATIDEARRRNIPFVEAELDRFPFTHAQVGVLVAEQWRFTPEMIYAIRDHHLPWSELGEGSQITRIVKAADVISHYLGIGHPSGFQGVRRSAEESLPEVWEALGVPPHRGPELLREASELVDQEADLYLGGGQ